MKKLIYAILFLFMLSYTGASFAETPYRLLVYGDSLSAGYRVGKKNSFASILQKELRAKGYKNVIVINKSKSGETTTGGLIRLKAVLETEKPNGVLLELGINDALRGNSVASIEKNLERMILLCQERGIYVLLAGMKAPPYTGILYQKEFNQMYEKLASKYRLIFYPFFMKGLIELENQIPDSKYVLSDNVHPNNQGISLMVQNIMPYVEKFIKESK